MPAANKKLLKVIAAAELSFSGLQALRPRFTTGLPFNTSLLYRTNIPQNLVPISIYWNFIICLYTNYSLVGKKSQTIKVNFGFFYINVTIQPLFTVNTILLSVAFLLELSIYIVYYCE